MTSQADKTQTKPPEVPIESPLAIPQATTAGSRIFNRMLAAFHYRDFRVLWFGSCTSSIGTWMQNVAENWLVLSLTGSAFFLGLDAFLQQLPIILFMLIGGVLADRFDRRRTLIVSQYIQMSCAFTLAMLVYSGHVHIWQILSLSFITGSAQAFGGPASQALVPSLVDKSVLPNAIALNSIQFNLARVIGPLLAGATLAAFGMVMCFGLNGLSFLVVIVALMALHVKHIAPAAPKRLRDELIGGLSYVKNHESLLELTILAATLTFFAFSMLTFLPLFAREVFRQDVGLYSRLMAFSATGSVIGALIIAWLGRYKRMGLTSLIMQGLGGLLIIAFASSRTLWLSEILLLAFGVCLMVVFSSVTSLVQLIAPNELRGRVMSIYMVALRGGMPLGSLISGYVASKIGAPTVLVVNGILLTFVATYFFLRSKTVREL
ncbi:MAG: putative multidrug-efflux transporterc [Acidobacteriales bacterium]|nr:putative multidrug-efflux transporterc [Terriglobales bacterium]